jgi:L-glyceraldehyde 3-phosphate reductase
LTYVAADDRYATTSYRRCGRSGLKLPAVSLGFWHNFAAPIVELEVSPAPAIGV